MPPRALFKGRQWPEGFAFPACTKCNDVTRQVEAAIALLARFDPDKANAEDEESDAEFRRILRGIKNNQPALLLELQPTANQTKKFLRQRGIDVPWGTTAAKVPLVRVNGPIMKTSVREFARKLLLALHYKETKQTIPQDGGMAYRWWSNVQIIEGKFPEEALRFIDRFPRLKRAKERIADQFSYRYNVSDDGELGAFAVKFGKSFVIVGLTVRDAAVLKRDPEKIEEGELLRPFSWSSETI